MKSNNSNTEAKIWFRKLNGHEWITLCNKYGIKVGISLTDERIEELYANEIEQMYKAEHPQPLKEDTTNTDTVTGGEFTKGNYSANGLHIMVDGNIIGQMHLMNFNHDNRGKSIPDTEGIANANRIVNCVNGWNDLQAENVRLREALKIAMASLGTYGRHPLIEEQANKALQNK